MEKTSFDAVYNQVAWELCVEAASKAKTELTLRYFAKEAGQEAIPVANVQKAAEMLVSNPDGSIRVTGSWIAGGRQGDLDLVCDEQFAPTVTETYVIRFIEDRIRMQIARKLFARGAPSIESLDSGE